MKKEKDEYCEKIFMVTAMLDKKIRFNELHRTLNKYGAKMSKPTLIEHLKHLIKKEIIKRHEEDTQKVSYELNWRRHKQLKKTKEFNRIALLQMKEEARFKSESLGFQTIFTAAMLTIGELFYLKLIILNILEPENNLQNSHAFVFIRKLYDIYAQMLLNSCKESKENSEKVLHLIDKNIKMLREACFVIKPKTTQQNNKTPRLIRNL